MKHKTSEPLVSTIMERCRLCYTCVRECPAKAIRIERGQAEVLESRCIGCGNCVKVCSQKAKKVRSSIAEVETLLALGDRVPRVAMIAPSFPAEFSGFGVGVLAGMVRKLGFTYVLEVSAGADAVAAALRRLISADTERSYIETSCPAIVAYVQKYHPDLVPSLSPIVSPMIATARIARKMYGPDLKVVFIGPCIAKKNEAAEDGSGVDAVLTFSELHELFRLRGISPDNVQPSDFDPPRPGLGMLFPMKRGVIQAARMNEDLLANEVLTADGRSSFIEAIRDFSLMAREIRLLEILCCNGCVMGPGMTTKEPLYRRMSTITRYAQQRLIQQSSESTTETAVCELSDSELRRSYSSNDQRIDLPSEEQIREVLVTMGKKTVEDELNCGSCGYDTCREHAIAICKGLAESEMCLPYSIERLRTSLEEVEESHRQLESTQEALMRAERLASMGQLSAGIAHEVNNPLGVVLIYAHMLLEETDPNSEHYKDLKIIVEETDRCKSIVAGLLDFARQNKSNYSRTDLPAIIDHYFEIFQKPAGIELTINHRTPGLDAELDPDQITQVLTNLISNAIKAMNDCGGLTVETHGDSEWACIKVSDTGVGIPKKNLSKIYEPFFTTRPNGEGTGLGLPVIYGIIKMHRGKIDVESNADPTAGPTGSTFYVRLPRTRQDEPKQEEKL